MSEEEKVNSLNDAENINSSQSYDSKSKNIKSSSSDTNSVLPKNSLAAINANYNNALRGSECLPPDFRAPSHVETLASQNLKNLWFASSYSADAAYKKLVSMRLPDTKSHPLAAKILSGFPNHNDKVAERLKKICEPSFKTGQILSKLAGKSDWANNAVGKTFLKYDTANINDSFNNSAIADIIKRNNKLNKQLFASPVAGYYRDLLKRGNILSDFNKSLVLCKNSLVQKKEEIY